MKTEIKTIVLPTDFSNLANNALNVAAEMAKRLLQKKGVESGVVNAAGDLTAWGFQPNGKPWTIGIADPEAVKHAFSYLDITNTSVATSGNYEKFIVIDGKKYSHTIDHQK